MPDWGAISLAVAGIVAAVLTALGTYKAGRDKAKADTEGRERKAYQDGVDSQAPRIAALEERAHILEAENMECQKLAARQCMAIEFQEKRDEQLHAELKSQGIRLGPFLAMPADLMAPVANPKAFAKRESEYTSQVIDEAVEAVKEDAKKIIPPEPPCKS